LTFSVPQDVKAHEQAAVALSEREQRVEKLRAQPQQLQTEAAQELKQGELLKLEKSLLGSISFHRRYFTLWPDKLVYQRLIQQKGSDEWTLDPQCEELPMSSIDSISFVDDLPSTKERPDKNATLTIERPSKQLHLGLNLRWPGGTIDSIEPGSLAAASAAESKGCLVPGLELVAINDRSVRGLSKEDVVVAYKAVLPGPLEEGVVFVTLTFAPAAPRLRFLVTMGDSYRRPGRIYQLQAFSRHECETWVEAIRYAKAQQRALDSGVSSLTVGAVVTSW